MDYKKSLTDYLEGKIEPRFDTPRFPKPEGVNPIEFYTDIASRLIGKRYIVDKDNNLFLTELMNWFFNRNDFSGDLSKGLFIRANVGRGKSVALLAFYHFTKWYKSINNSYNKSFNYKELLEIESKVKNKSNFEYTISDSKLINLYNDVGREGKKYDLNKPITSNDKVVHKFNNDTNIFADILEQEYLRFQLKGTPAIIITNYDIELYKTWYGVEVYSRIHEMFNFIELEGKDRRKV